MLLRRSRVGNVPGGIKAETPAQFLPLCEEGLLRRGGAGHLFGERVQPGDRLLFPELDRVEAAI